MARRFLSNLEVNVSPASSPHSDGGARQNESSGSISLGVVIAVCIIAFVATKVLGGSLLYWRWATNRKICEVCATGGKMVLFRSSEKVTPSTKAVLKKAENLNNKDIIGSGGYGTVYRLVLDDQTAYAVKKLARSGIERERGFERELEALSDIRHRNLITLRGYYRAPQINLLFYDLMPNGSLANVLYDRLPDQEPLDWHTRYSIALDVSHGLAYLHHDCIPHIIHRDIKSSNILLDENMEARICDFGLAKLINPSQTHVTTVVAGTLGYLAPEYVDTGRATEKGDVYSFGVLLLELITGKRPTDKTFVEKGINLVTWVRTLAEIGQEKDVFDQDLIGSCSEIELKETMDIACQCLDPDPHCRPTMAQVVKMLENITAEVDENKKLIQCREIFG
eukprot:c22091_g1_i5 orf=170-1351(-)